MGVSRRIQDQHDLNDGAEGSQFGEGDLAQGGILGVEVALVRNSPTMNTRTTQPFPSSTLSLSPV